MSSNKQVLELLRSTRCIDILRGQKIVEIDAEQTISQACQVQRLGLLMEG